MAKFDNSNSSISAEDCAVKSRISELKANENYIFWLDAEPTTGRKYIVSYELKTGKSNKLTLSIDYNVKTSINEYGGGSYWLNNEYLYFYNKDDGAVYYIDLQYSKDKYFPTVLKGTLSEESNNIYNYSSGVVLKNGDFIAIRETVSIIQSRTQQELIYYNKLKDQLSVIHDSHDFYAFLRLNIAEKKLLWLSWDHPHMPWEHTVLYSADLSSVDNSLVNIKEQINISNNSLYQPEWIDDSNILIVSEHDPKSPYWNLYRFNLSTKKLLPVVTGDFELGLALWILDTNTYCIERFSDHIVISFYKLSKGKVELGLVRYFYQDQNVDPIEILKENKQEQSCIHIEGCLNKRNNNIYYIGGTQFAGLSVYKHDLLEHTQTIINEPARLSLNNENNISCAQEIVFKNNFGQEIYGFYYVPLSQDYELPLPLIVICHGGPTASTNIMYNKKIQYWTSRGFSVIDVNYSGSTTYGRNYRNRLNGLWAIIDVADCAAAAEYLISQDKADRNKIYISGSSAGGLTALNALYKYEVFTAACCYYPVCDLVTFEEDIHNFEKYYSNSLIGDFKKDFQEYELRSPVNFADKIKKPVLLFHGTQDKVVPIEQSKKLFNKIKNNNVYNNFIEYEGEGHGFRGLDAISQSLTAEFEFYQGLNDKSERLDS